MFKTRQKSFSKSQTWFCINFCIGFCLFWRQKAHFLRISHFEIVPVRQSHSKWPSVANFYRFSKFLMLRKAVTSLPNVGGTPAPLSLSNLLELRGTFSDLFFWCLVQFSDHVQRLAHMGRNLTYRWKIKKVRTHSKDEIFVSGNPGQLKLTKTASEQNKIKISLFFAKEFK